MKNLACLVLTIGSLTSSVACFAQSTGSVTREQVNSDLSRVEQAGYHAGEGDQATYPAQIQSAEARVTAQDNQQAVEARVTAQDNQQAADSAVGGTTPNGTSAAGSPMRSPTPSPASCVGPASYCHIFFGN